MLLVANTVYHCILVALCYYIKLTFINLHIFELENFREFLSFKYLNLIIEGVLVEITNTSYNIEKLSEKVNLNSIILIEICI